MTPTPLSDAEITQLEALLSTPAFAQQSMGLDEIQGFLAAIISGPAPVETEQWLAAALGNPDFESADQAEDVRALLLRFHAEIEADLKGGESLGLVLNLAEGADEGEGAKYDYAAWCQAYLDGVDSSPAPWDEVGDEEEINELLFPVALLAGEIDTKILKVKPRELAELMAECEEDLPLLVIEAYQYFSSVRGKPLVKRAPVAGKDGAGPRKETGKPPAQVGKKKPVAKPPAK